MFSNHSTIIITLAGICMFMFGMSIASESLQKILANRLRDLMVRLSTNPFSGVAIGIGLTLMIQSSGAVTSMLVGLGSAGVITLQQVMSVIIGTAIGTTFTVQLLSFNVAQWGMPTFILSFCVYFLTNKRGLKNVMSVVMGFGLIFWGLEFITVGTNAVRDAELLKNSLSVLNDHPVYCILITAFFTAVVHSSAVTIGLAMSLAISGSISLEQALFWVYGANIGTTATALVAASGGNYIGKRVAWAHFLYKVVSVVIFYFFTSQFAELISGDDVTRSVANAHTFLNILSALAFLPLIKYGVKLVEFLIPKSGEKEFTVKFLNRGDFSSPTIALAHAEREVLRMGDIVATMVRDSIDLFIDQDLELERSIRDRDNKVDLLNKEINLFLANWIDEDKNPHGKHMLKLMLFASDLESAADVIDNSILDLAGKKHALKVEFSKEGWEELHDLHAQVSRLFPKILTCVQMRSVELAEEIIDAKRHIRRLEKNYKKSHMHRLVEGKSSSINTSSIHLDTLNEYRRVVGLATNFIYTIRGGRLTESDDDSD